MYFSVWRIVPAKVVFKGFRLEWIESATGDFNEKGFGAVAAVEMINLGALCAKEEPPTAELPGLVGF
jgi:hypothetical protein